MNFDAIPMTPVPNAGKNAHPDLPHVTHAGSLVVGDMTLNVFQLSDGRRVIDKESLRPFLDVLGL